MKKNFGPKTWLYPMPVLIIATYDENGHPNAMNAAWGGVYDTNQVMLCLSENHKTTKNILATGAFTISMADAAHVVGCDYVGIVSGNKEPDKVAKAGFTTVKSEFVNAPVICELPMAVECKLIKMNEDGIVIGEIVNISADESVLAADGQIDVNLLRPIAYDPVRHDYLTLGEKVGKAFHDGGALK